MNARDHTDIRLLIDEFLASDDLSPSDEHPCPYLPDRTARDLGFAIDELPSELYHAFLDRGFRRSGQIVYRPDCPDCSLCTQIRVPVDRFLPSRSQRRVWRRNRDVNVSPTTTLQPTQDKWRLFHTYVHHQHDDTMPTAYDDFRRFLYSSPTRTVEFTYRLRSRTVGISIADRCPEALSSVYMFFDPQHHRRSLGTYSILWEIDYCRRHHIPYYYLGFYVPGSPNMAYKANFKPHELLDDDFTWRIIEK